MPDENMIRDVNFELTNRFVEKFIETYRSTINRLVLENGGDAEFAVRITERVLLEIYYRIRYVHYDRNADNRLLINTIAFKLLANEFCIQKKSKPLKVSIEILNPDDCKLFINRLEFNEKLVDKALKEIGEPGRTALKLSFFDKADDENIVSHIQAESVKEMNKKRIHFLNKCVDLLNING